MSVAIGVTFDNIGSRAYPQGGDIPIFWQLTSSIEQRVLLKRNNGSFESPAAAAAASRSARCAAALSTALPNRVVMSAAPPPPTSARLSLHVNAVLAAIRPGS